MTRGGGVGQVRLFGWRRWTDSSPVCRLACCLFNLLYSSADAWMVPSSKMQKIGIKHVMLRYTFFTFIHLGTLGWDFFFCFRCFSCEHDVLSPSQLLIHCSFLLEPKHLQNQIDAILFFVSLSIVLVRLKIF